MNAIKMPKILANYKLTDVINNEVKNKGLGCTYSYSSTGVKANLYIYNLGHDCIPEGINSDIVKQHFGEILDDIYTVYPNAIEMEEIKGYLYSDVPLVTTSFNLLGNSEEGTESEFSHVYLTSLNNNLIKLRMTYSSDNQPTDFHENYELFINELIKSIK